MLPYDLPHKQLKNQSKRLFVPPEQDDESDGEDEEEEEPILKEDYFSDPNQ